MDLLQEENIQEKEGRQCLPLHSIHWDQMINRNHFIGILQFQGSFINAANGSMIKVRYSGSKWKKAQDLGLQFGQTKSHGMIVYQTAPPECVCKELAKRDKETIFDKLHEAQPAPKVILKSHW